MKSFTHSRSRKRKSGFTLVELMVVIMIISILSGVVLSAMNSSDDSRNLDAGVTRLDSLFSLARSAAITRKQTTRVLISFESGGNTSFYKYHPVLRMVTIVYLDDDGKWKVYTNPEFLPDGVFFSPALSTSTQGPTPPLHYWDLDINMDTLIVSNPPYNDVWNYTSPYSLTDGNVDEVKNLNSGPGPNRWLSFEFKPNGTFSNPGARVVLVNATQEWLNGQIALRIPLEDGTAAEDIAKGFVVFRSGKVLHFQSGEQIKEGNS